MKLKYLEKYETVCQCGCGEPFMATALYRKRSEGGGLALPLYQRGHHPSCRENQTGQKPPWNKGLSKDDHPSISRMGFQPGHEPYNDWSHIHHLMRNDDEYRARWLESKKGQIPWNKDLTRDDYPNPPKFPSGPDHWKWLGGRQEETDTSRYKRFRKSILKRDNYTCQDCGDRNRQGRGSRIALEVHHIRSVAEFPDGIYETSNVVVLCRACHYKTHNFGAKNIRERRKKTKEPSVDPIP
jgi:hypothetical protein